MAGSGERQHGRRLAATRAQGDDGRADPALAAALTGGDPAAVASAVAGARVFVAVETALVGVDAAGADKEADLALVTVRLPEGGTGLPAFSSLAALADFRSSVRPVAVAGRELAAEALRLGHSVLVLDPAGPAVRVGAAAVAEGWSPVAGLAGAAARTADLRVRPTAVPLRGPRRRRLARALEPVRDVADVYEVEIAEAGGGPWRPALGVAPRPGVPAAAVGRVAAALAATGVALDLVVLDADRVAAVAGAPRLSD